MPKPPTAPRRPASPHRKAEQHLATAHPAFARMIAAVGPCTLRSADDHFLALVCTVISQQISVKAADTIERRLFDLIRPRKLTPKNFLKLTDEQMRGAGVSAAKSRAIRELAARFADGRINLSRLEAMADDEVAAQLLPVPGIGPWSVQMFLIFVLGRPNVLPVGDLGLRIGVMEQFGLPSPPTAKELEELARPWHPYCTVATWYFWKSRGNVPYSGE